MTGQNEGITLCLFVCLLLKLHTYNYKKKEEEKKRGKETKTPLELCVQILC